MPTRSARRPWPALIFLLALAVLAVVVWYRVTNRPGSQAAAGTVRVCASAGASTVPAPASVTVNVLNGKGTNNLAQQTLDAFVAAGFHPGSIGNAPGATGVATVTAGAQGTMAAKLVSFYLPGATLGTDSRADTSVTVTLGPNFTAMASPQQAQAALAKAGLKQAAPTPTASAAPTAKASAGATGSPAASC